MSEPKDETSAAAPAEDLEDLYENAPCGYLSLSPEGLIVKVNRTFCEWTGFAADEIRGRRFRDLLTMGGRMFYETHFAPLLRMQGFFNEVALDVMAASGEKLPVLANANERRTATGDLIFTRITIFLAAHRRRFERELVDARTAADATSHELAARFAAEKESGELREQFIAVLGHDLRAPLTAIESGVRLLQREAPSETATKILRLIQGSTLRMSGLISNVLDFARGKLGGGLGVTPVPDKPLRLTLEQVIAEIQTSVAERVIEAELAVDAPVAVDHDRIAQVLANLLGNAVTHGDPERPISVQASVSQGELKIAVANAGPAIPPEAMVHLFQPFYRASVRPSRQGLGLGLYIAAEIAKAHGGRIDVTSDDQETRFTLTVQSK